MVLTIKRKSNVEKYDEKKVYASVYAAALNAHHNERESEELADVVSKRVTKWAKNHSHIDSNDIREQIISNLKELDKDVAVMYKHHLDLC